MSVRARIVFGVLAALILAVTVYYFTVQQAEIKTEKQVFRIALDTGPNHVRNIMVDRFVKRLEKATNGQLDIQVFHSGQIAKGRDVPKALVWGTAHMGVVAMPHLARYSPDANLFGMPIFYGLAPEYSRVIADGKIGQALSDRLEKKLRVKILSPYLELGAVITFTTKTQITQPKDYRGLKIRAPGGASSVARLSSLGASAIGLPFADVPLSLSQGAMDGASSTYESIRSAKLWQSGLTYSFEDGSEVLFYAPMISRHFWERAPKPIQLAILESWAGVANDARAIATSRQLAARAEFTAAGGIVSVGSPEDLKVAREAMAPKVDAIARSLGMDVVFLKSAQNAILQHQKSLEMGTP